MGFLKSLELANSHRLELDGVPGQLVGSLGDSDTARFRLGTDRFRVCRPSTRPGVFKIKAKLSVQDESGKDYQEGWLPVTRFRLRLP